MAHKHGVRDTNAHFIIDPYTKVITNDSTKKTAIAQYDHNSQRLTFEIPAIDGHSMTLCDLIEIHFINISADGKSFNDGVYEVKDIALNGENSVFTWLVSQDATQYAGSLNFIIIFKCTEDGVTVYRWSTEIHKSLSVSDGMDNGESVLREYPDILAQWKADLFGVGDTEEQRLLNVSAEQQAAIAEAGQNQIDAINGRGEAVLATIPDEYETVSALADENARIKAGAIVLDADGESIVVNDSADAYMQGLKVFGKSEQLKTNGYQLFDSSGYTGTKIVVGEDGWCTCNIDNSGNESKMYVGFNTPVSELIEPDTEYLAVIEIDENSGCGFEVTSTTNGQGQFKTAFYVSPTAGVAGSVVVKPVTTISDFSGCTVMLRTTVNCEANVKASTKFRISLYKDTSITEETFVWEPYSGGVASPSPEWAQEINSVENLAVSVRGKNLVVNQFEAGYTEVRNGVTFAVNPDGSIHVSGSSTGATAWNMMVDAYLPIGTYRISGAPGNASTKFRLQVNKTVSGVEKTGGVDTGTGAYLHIDTPNTKIRLYIYVASDAGTVDGVFYPQIEIGTVTTEYEARTAQSLAMVRTLPGIPVSSGGNYTDANGQQWICDEVDFARGVYVKRVGAATYTGDSTEYVSTYGLKDSGFAVSRKSNDYMLPAGSDVVIPAFCNKLTVASTADIYSLAPNAKFAFSTGGNVIRFSLDALSGLTVDEVRSWLSENPLTFVYLLETIIETPLSDAEITAFKELKSHKPTTTILNDSGAFMAAEYVADTKTYIDNKIAEMGVTV